MSVCDVCLITFILNKFNQFRRIEMQNKGLLWSLLVGAIIVLASISCRKKEYRN